MLFKVRYMHATYTVYSVKQAAIANDSLFLVFEKSKKIWLYLLARDCEPIEE